MSAWAKWQPSWEVTWRGDGRWNWFFVPMPWNFFGEEFCNTYVGGVASVLQYPFPGCTIEKIAILCKHVDTWDLIVWSLTNHDVSCLSLLAKIVPVLVGGFYITKIIVWIGASFWFTAFSMAVPCGRNNHWERSEPKGLLGNAVNQRSCWGMAIGNPVNEKGFNAIIHNLLSK
jgi:hypothetical protein